MHGSSAVAIYQSLAPDMAVPVALTDAQARADEARASRPPEAAPPVLASFINNTTIDDKWFADTYCTTANYWETEICRLNQTKQIGANFIPTDEIDGSIWNSDVDELYQAGCSDRGEEDMWVELDGSHLEWTLVQGHCIAYHWTSGWLNTESKSGVYHLFDNARFHLSVRTHS